MRQTKHIISTPRSQFRHWARDTPTLRWFSTVTIDSGWLGARRRVSSITLDVSPLPSSMAYDATTSLAWVRVLICGRNVNPVGEGIEWGERSVGMNERVCGRLRFQLREEEVQNDWLFWRNFQNIQLGKQFQILYTTLSGKIGPITNRKWGKSATDWCDMRNRNNIYIFFVLWKVRIKGKKPAQCPHLWNEKLDRFKIMSNTIHEYSVVVWLC